MSVLTYALLATTVVSIISLIGILFLGLKKEKVEEFLFFTLSFSTGTLIGTAFFHLLPEALEGRVSLEVFEILIVGFLFFYFLERILRWHHCHEETCETHKFLGYQNLVGDGIHNFIDGLVIVSAFGVDVRLGIAVTASVITHEIPQEIGDFGVLLYSGFSKTRALLFNLLSALLSVAGVLVGYLLINRIEIVQQFLIPFAAGGFIYIAASDLIPELHKEKNTKKSLLASAIFLCAVFLMLVLKEN